MAVSFEMVRKLSLACRDAVAHSGYVQTFVASKTGGDRTYMTVAMAGQQRTATKQNVAA